MTASKSLPERPSLESLRKQAKKLARDVAAGDAAAITRVGATLPNVRLPLTQRTAQLVIAREYGFAGWHELLSEVNQRLGNGLEWAATSGATRHPRQQCRAPNEAPERLSAAAVLDAW